MMLFLTLVVFLFKQVFGGVNLTTSEKKRKFWISRRKDDQDYNEKYNSKIHEELDSESSDHPYFEQKQKDLKKQIGTYYRHTDNSNSSFSSEDEFMA